MEATDIQTFAAFEDCGVTLLSRVFGNGGVAIVAADITSIAYKVFDLTSSTPGTATQSGSLTPGDVIYDTLQLDALWKKADGSYVDNSGYNFHYAAPATWFPDGDHLYLVEIVYTPTSGQNFADWFRIHARNLRS